MYTIPIVGYYEWSEWNNAREIISRMPLGKLVFLLDYLALFPRDLGWGAGWLTRVAMAAGEQEEC